MERYRRIHRHVGGYKDRRQGDLISLLLFFENKGSRLKRPSIYAFILFISYKRVHKNCTSQVNLISLLSFQAFSFEQTFRSQRENVGGELKIAV
jgi:hypothetical protein